MNSQELPCTIAIKTSAETSKLFIRDINVELLKRNRRRIFHFRFEGVDTLVPIECISAPVSKQTMEFLKENDCLVVNRTNASVVRKLDRYQPFLIRRRDRKTGTWYTMIHIEKGD